MVSKRRTGRDFIARHGETVFNSAGRLQGNHAHTPLTRAGFAQAEAIGRALRDHLGVRPALTLWSSSAGRALQTLAIIAEHLELDWHAARVDDRLVEIDVGDWSGRYYRELLAEAGIADSPRAREHLLRRLPPGGEGHAAIATRLASWLAETDGDAGDRLVVMHGLSSRILRGLMTGLRPAGDGTTPLAPALPQGSVTLVEQGREHALHRGTGGGVA